MTSEKCLKQIILNLQEPHIFKNLKIPWTCFSMSFEEWCKLFDSELSDEHGIEFEIGNKMFSGNPQWERFRGKSKMSLTTFFKESLNPVKNIFEEKWVTYSYKNIKDIPKKCCDGVSFTSFGFSNVNDITLWLSSEGAHTPCHYDSYGCNIVVQVYGRKRWLLFPPGTELTATRIPYEESSIYCSEGFFSPNKLSQFSKIQSECYMCVLEPGDVLVLPKNWWHYVENLCPALSINTWIPLVNDCDAQIEECIVKLLVEKLTDFSNHAEICKIFNPNQIEQILDEDDLFKILEVLIKEKMSNENNEEMNNKYPYQYLAPEDLETVRKLPESEFLQLMQENSKRHTEQINKTDEQLTNKLKEIFINSICTPSVIRNIKEIFLEKCKIYEK